ncbi:MAG: transketolase C-terminal domain-containing protein [Candidatus Paceibacterota bacterium]|jgi:transketolase
MINISQKLNPKLFDKDVEQIPIRKGFGEGFLEAGEKNPNIVGLSADLAESTQMHLFKNKFPERFIEVGIAEQNLASVASGLSAMGKIPFISSFSAFSPGRNWEQIRTTICYNNRSVVLVGSHAGFSDGADGGTHQSLEDIALMRVLPRMTVISPCDSIEAKKATLAAAESGKVVYLRLLREKTPVMTTKDSPFEIGKAQLFYGEKDEKVDVGIVVTGSLVYKALKVAEALKKEKISAKVLSVPTIKPIDNEAIINIAKTCGAIVTVEEHQIAGGFGSAVAEVVVQNFSVPMEFIGVKDQFGQSGTPNELLEYYEIGESHILFTCKEVIGRKN